MILRTLLLGLLWAPAVSAQAVHDCDWPTSAAFLQEPWEDHTRTFSNGQVRLALLNTDGEPAFGAFHLLVLSPPLDELGARQCRVIAQENMGFAWIDFAGLEGSYAPATGLTFTLPVEIAVDQDFIQKTLRLTLNQSTGAITAEVSQ